MKQVEKFLVLFNAFAGFLNAYSFVFIDNFLKWINLGCVGFATFAIFLLLEDC